MQTNDTSTGLDYQEIRDLLAQVARRQAETAKLHEENAQQLKETAQFLKESAEEADLRTQETDRQIKELKQQIGGLGEKFGGFTEGMAFPSMSKILKERFRATFVAPRVRSWRNGSSLEVDVLAYSNSGTNEVYVVEVKSHLREEGVQQMLKTLREFRSFFPEHRDRKLYGILAVVDAPPELQQRVLREGIYLARIHDGVFEVQVPDDFQPRAF
jgi:hypothetical protein